MLKINCAEFNGDASGLFNECGELKMLKITRSHSTEFIADFAQKYPDLEELYNDDVSINIRTMFALLQFNSQIKKLDMFYPNVDETICAVASKMDKLEELILRCKLNSYDNISELGKLKSLKVLELHDTAYELVAAIEALQNVPLERLKWIDCPSNLEFMNSILKLKTLKSLALRIISSPFDSFLIKLGEQLPLLEALEFEFKHQDKSLFSIGCLSRLIELSPKLYALVIHTNHSKEEI